MTPVLILLLFLLASLGHLILTVYSHNYWYGVRMNRHLTDVMQFLHALLLLAGPIVLLLTVGWDLTPIFSIPPESELSWQLLAVLYLGLCWLTALIIFPLITWYRLQRRPASLLHESSLRLDIANKLGYKPIGRGRYQSIARLPANQIFQLNLIERRIHLPQIPDAWHGLTILHLSDLHMYGSPDRPFFQVAMDLCNEWQPDLIALTGDYIDSVYYHRWVIPALGRLKSQIATFAILGNHDHWHEPGRLRRRLRRVGFHVLENNIHLLDLRGHPLVVIGHEGPWLKPAPDLSECPEGFRLCLSHTPDNLYWGQKNEIDLMLSGHVHGGQIRFPVIGSVVVPSIYGRRFDRGVFESKPTVLHVTSGMGGKHPVRYGCPPEAVLLTLMKSSEEAQ